ncbi:co-chaperone YbbN [Arthrobacter sp. ISL-5]|uniref:thioredoxin family protein n=1 Tax=Arthrobacter sp. ISL-5 TaxID=2819111 RepID=UPI001BEB1BAA|nr:thioredoxin family protein [Arthrobacter sp. ISL-5]MBT2555485.1 hypothetical protein [Arthrobacter sp. ISL-5]
MATPLTSLASCVISCLAAICRNPGVASRLGITSIPAILLFDAGRLRAAVIGARPKQFLEREFADYLG